MTEIVLKSVAYDSQHFPNKGILNGFLTSTMEYNSVEGRIVDHGGVVETVTEGEEDAQVRVRPAVRLGVRRQREPNVPAAQLKHRGPLHQRLL